MSEKSFIVNPYLQLGDFPKLTVSETMLVQWHAPDMDHRWDVQIKRADSDAWTPCVTPTWRLVAVSTIERHRIYRALLTALEPGSVFNYQVLRDGVVVFLAEGKVRKGTHQPYRVVIMGDCGYGDIVKSYGMDGHSQTAIAHQIYQLQPDLVVIPGDAVYLWGRISEYRSNFYPYYNADQGTSNIGVPLMCSIPFVTGLGQHDTGQPDVDKYPDSLGYYLNWALPLNGPALHVDDPNTFRISGERQHKYALLEAAGDQYPRMANYSFDFGNSHWTVVDSNPHVDWRTPPMRSWLADDLTANRSARWRFVACYMPPFNPSKEWPHAQRMRLVTDIFEAGAVNLVFSGYVHSYHRTLPLTFKPGQIVSGHYVSGPDAPGAAAYQVVIDGDFHMDRQFDGRQQTWPRGIIYLTTGGGAGTMHNPEQTHDPASWAPFTQTYIADVASLTVMDVTDDSLTVRQISEAGRELDRFVVTHQPT